MILRVTPATDHETRQDALIAIIFLPKAACRWRGGRGHLPNI
jgi:hypothetical protein